MSTIEVDKIKNTTSATSVKVDRTTSDGDIIELQKDGTTVGSIGAGSGEVFIGNGDMGIRFDDISDAIKPYNPSSLAIKDAAINLGVSSQRFKDLYLSGNIYLGGTGAANALDDYETGTWTPVFTGETSAGSYSYSFNNGYYTKIGDIVHASFRLINITDVSAGSGNVVITGLPFTVAGDGIPNHQSVFTTYFTASTDSDWQLSLDNNDTTFRFRRVNSGTGVTMQVSDKVNNLADIYTLFTYRV